jgi:O-antigen biosynthesis protein
MNLSEISRIGHAIARRLTNPQENPLTIGQMARFYIEKTIYRLFHRLPAIQVPFAFVPDDINPAPRVAVIAHCYYADLISELLDRILMIPCPYALYVSTDRDDKRQIIEGEIKKRKISKYEIRLAPNRGRDIAPKYVTFSDVYKDCDYFLHLHSKKSPHAGSFGDHWRRHLLTTLLGSPAIVRSIFLLLQDPRIGLVFPVALNDTLPALRWGANFKVSATLAQRLKTEIDPRFCPDYPDGGMMWGKSVAIKPLLDLGLNQTDFHEEKGQLDGCLNHAIERMAMHSAFKQKLVGCRITTNPSYPNIRLVADERALASTITACLEAQEQERFRCDRLSRK